MPTLSVKDIPLGSTISFRSKSAVDGVLWKGKLELIGSYTAIRGFGNPGPYNEEVRQSDPTVSSELSDLTFFLFTIDNSSSKAGQHIFAEEWIQPGSLAIIDQSRKVTVVVDDPHNNPQQIISILANSGYSCRIST